jgi:prepilin-type N-terminal cleavage/methylation domain-containing protein
MKNPSLYRPILAARSRRGFTLSEMAVALGIIGMVIAAIWVAAASVGLNNQVNQAAQELQAVSQNMLSLYQGRPWPPAAGCSGVATDITSTAINASVIPSTYVVNGACASALQVWGGAGTFTISAPTNSTFRISFANVPLQGCIALLMQVTGCDPSQAGCPVQVETNNGASTLSPGASSAGGWQATLTPTTATTLCNANGSAGPVAFDFKL